MSCYFFPSKALSFYTAQKSLYFVSTSLLFSLCLNSIKEQIISPLCTELLICPEQKKENISYSVTHKAQTQCASANNTNRITIRTLYLSVQSEKHKMCVLFKRAQCLCFIYACSRDTVLNGEKHCSAWLSEPADNVM